MYTLKNRRGLNLKYSIFVILLIISFPSIFFLIFSFFLFYFFAVLPGLLPLYTNCLCCPLLFFSLLICCCETAIVSCWPLFLLPVYLGSLMRFFPLMVWSVQLFLKYTLECSALEYGNCKIFVKRCFAPCSDRTVFRTRMLIYWSLLLLMCL